MRVANSKSRCAGSARRGQRLRGSVEVSSVRDRVVDGGERGHDGHEDRDMGPVDLPDAQGDARGSREKPCLVEGTAERQGTGRARAEDKDLRGVRKAEAGRDGFRPGIAGDVGVEDDEHAQAAEHVQAQVTRPLRRRSRGRHDACLRPAERHDIGTTGFRRQGRAMGSIGSHDGSHGGPDPALRLRRAADLGDITTKPERPQRTPEQPRSTLMASHSKSRAAG